MSKSVAQIEGTYVVLVDFDMSIEELLDLGKYNSFCGEIISDNFPTKRAGKVETEIVLIPFDSNISHQTALKVINAVGYRPAEPHEVLALGAKYPDLQRKSLIVALGSFWHDSRGPWAVCLHGWSMYRNIILALPSGSYKFGNWLCATVRKVDKEKRKATTERVKAGNQQSLQAGAYGGGGCDGVGD